LENIIQYQYLKVNLLGGIISSGSLLEILNIFKHAEIEDVSFGTRQQLIGHIKHNINRDFLTNRLKSDLENNQIDYELNGEKHPNIITSFCAEEVFSTGKWVSEGTYIDVLDQFDFTPFLKINVSDSDQSFTPFFTGNVNFIASPEKDYWYLYVRPRQTNELIKVPFLIFTSEIGKVYKWIEEYNFTKDISPNIFFDYLANKDFIRHNINEQLNLPTFKLPYYEGFNRYGDKTWLGIYRRKEKFKIDFLIDLCKLCLDTKIGQICTTPWKSIIIKNIANQHREAWDTLLGIHGINVRHAANELNWCLEDYQPDALALKLEIIKQYDDFDIRTFGLCFTLQTKAKSEVFGSVVIKQRRKYFGLTKYYDVYHTADFNPNTRDMALFERNVSKSNLAGILFKISRFYYSKKTIKNSKTIHNDDHLQSFRKIVHQCKTCLTVYDARYGDIQNNIAAGVLFSSLNENYSCPICEANKDNFLEVMILANDKSK
jgi:rubredoxin